MAGELTPLVMLPRYTTYAGATEFTTIAMDVTEYSSVILSVWRGPINFESGGAAGTFAITLQESTDQVNWTTCTGTTANSDPGENTDDGPGISDDQLPEDLVPSEDNPLAEGLEDRETVEGLLDGGKTADEMEPDGDDEDDEG